MARAVGLEPADIQVRGDDPGERPGAGEIVEGRLALHAYAEKQDVHGRLLSVLEGMP
jgi:hypothetical protein